MDLGFRGLRDRGLGRMSLERAYCGFSSWWGQVLKIQGRLKRVGLRGLLKRSPPGIEGCYRLLGFLSGSLDSKGSFKGLPEGTLGVEGSFFGAPLKEQALKTAPLKEPPFKESPVREPEQELPKKLEEASLSDFSFKGSFQGLGLKHNMSPRKGMGSNSKGLLKI